MRCVRGVSKPQHDYTKMLIAATPRARCASIGTRLAKEAVFRSLYLASAKVDWARPNRQSRGRVITVGPQLKKFLSRVRG